MSALFNIESEHFSLHIIESPILSRCVFIDELVPSVRVLGLYCLDQTGRVLDKAGGFSAGRVFDRSTD